MGVREGSGWVGGNERVEWELRGDFVMQAVKKPAGEGTETRAAAGRRYK